MTEISSDWLLYTGCEPKKNRAKLVCIFCHSKKIKCDLQPRIDRGRSKCSKCDASGRECRPRPSKRTKRPVASAPPVADQLSATSSSSPDASTTFPNPSDCTSVIRLSQPPSLVLDAESPTAATVATSVLDGGKMASVEIDVLSSSVSEASDSRTAAAGHRAERHSFSHPTAHSRPHVTSSAGLTALPPPPPQRIPHAPVHAIGLAPQTTASPTELAARSHGSDLDTGFLQLYGPENEYDAERQEFEAQLGAKSNLSDHRQQELLQSFAETYFEYCYTWCPVLDRDTLADSLHRSPLLANALATASSHIQPPLVPHEGPGTYYKRASSLFYSDEEPDSLTSIKAVTLLYWWAPRPPSTVHRHSSWWWTSVVIRHAQQMNFHREPHLDHPLRQRLDMSSRRLIWWTAFARERLTALCQSKPCIIDPEDCSISEPTLADFPSEPALQKKGEIFIYWVKLCAIIGKVAKVLMRPPSASKSADLHPMHLRRELANWAHSLPEHLRLPIHSARTRAFDRDVQQLHLPYLTTIIILNMKRSPHALPEALPPAILAASCIARILRDILSRGNVRYLMAITCWYSGMAFAALLQAAQIPELSAEANEELDVLVQAVTQLQTMWASANIIRQGFDRLRSSVSVMPNTAGTSSIRYRNVVAGPAAAAAAAAAVVVGVDESVSVGGVNGVGGMPAADPQTFPTTPGAAPGISEIQDKDFDWVDFFPFVTPATNGIAEVLLNGKDHGPATRLPSPEDLMFQDAIFSNYQDIVEPFHDIFMSELIRQSWNETAM